MGENGKDLGKRIGKLNGILSEKQKTFTEKALQSDFLNDVAKEVKVAAGQTGSLLGEVKLGATDLSGGLWNQDQERAKQGAKNLGRFLKITVKGVQASKDEITSSTRSVIEGAMEGDIDQIKNSSKDLIKKTISSTLAVGIIDAGITALEAEDQEKKTSSLTRRPIRLYQGKHSYARR